MGNSIRIYKRLINKAILLKIHYLSYGKFIKKKREAEILSQES